MKASDTDHKIPVSEPGSYRDFSARVFYAGRRVFRGLGATAIDPWRDLQGTMFFQKAQQAGTVVRTVELTAAERADLSARFPTGDDSEEEAPWRSWPVILEHDRLPFVSYPYEWSFSMLKDAALLHLDLLDAALAEGFVIKDGTAFNVQWIGSRPVFVDVTSFIRYEPGQPWAGYRQFCQTFLYPLMLQAYRKVNFQSMLRGDLDGMSPGTFRKLLSWRDVFRPGVMQHVLIHSLFEKRVTETSEKTHTRLAQTGLNADIVRATVRNLRRTVERLETKAASHWTGYVNDNVYSPQDQELKAEFVRSAVAASNPRRVWDLGCNTGEYAKICAETAPYVMALDADAACIERLYLSLKSEQQGGAPVRADNILPMVYNVVNSSPNMGWRGRERKGLPERGRPQLCLCLALLHHLVISASVPMAEILAWLRELRSYVVIEFVDRDDPMAAALLRGRPDDCPEYRREAFEKYLRHNFEIERTVALTGAKRTLYLARSRDA